MREIILIFGHVVMAGICCGLVEGETAAPIEPGRASRRRRLDIMPLKLMADMAVPATESTSSSCGLKRQKLDLSTRDCKNAVESSELKEDQRKEDEVGKEKDKDAPSSLTSALKECDGGGEVVSECPKFGVTSVCGRRRDMEDAVSVRPSFCQESNQNGKDFHYFGVFDGHGCSHVSIYM